MGSISGLKQISATSIQNAGQIYLGNNLDSGNPGEVIISNGAQQAVSWGSNSATLPGALTAGTNLSLASGNASFDGTIADTLNASALTITGGKGISVVGGTEILTDNDNTTINNSGGTGNQNQVLKVPNALTFTGASTGTFDGSSALSINLTNSDNQLNLTAALPIVINDLGGLNREVDIDIDTDTMGVSGGELEVLKVPNTLTINSTPYDGSVARNFTLPTTDTTYQGSSTINIDTSTNPDTINCLKVPNVMTASTNIIFTNTDDGAAATNYDGSQPITIRATDTNTEYTAGTNLNLAGTTFNLDTSITTQTGITFLNNGSSTNLTGSNYPNKPTIATNLDLTSSTNIMPHPSGVFDEGFFGVEDLRMSINLSNFMPNDDSSFYNIAVEDDFASAIMGTIKPQNSSLEVCGYFVIPEGYTATAARIDLNNSSGTPVSRLTQAYSITTYGGTGFTTLASFNTGAEGNFFLNMVAASDKIMLIKIFTAATTDHIRGGYIKLTRN